MKVLIFHPVLLPAKKYGGVERVVIWLAKGLRERGHEVWVAAHGGSELPLGAKLLPIEPERSSALDLIPKIPKGVEVVHFMAPPEEGTLEKLGCSSLLTVHGNGKEGESFPKNTAFLSQDHAKRHGSQVFVYNGIDPEDYVFEPGRKEPSFLFLSKTSWSVKNVKGAAKLCMNAQVPLKIAGGDRPYGIRLQSRFSRYLEWIGPVAKDEKALLLSRSRALVFPVLWPEPFGLVVAEALMSGTPVFANAKGSLPELVNPKVGALFHSETDPRWASALRSKAMRFEPEACRAWAMEKFHYLKMAAGYEELYRRVIKGDVLNPENPVASDWRKQ